MRTLRLVAVRTLAESRGLQGVMGAAFGRSSLRVTSFWIGHGVGLEYVIDQESFLSVFNTASRGSSQARAHVHVPRFRLIPHTGHRPAHSSRHNGFIGSA